MTRKFALESPRRAPSLLREGGVPPTTYDDEKGGPP